MTRTELIIQLLKVVIGLAFGAYFVWWSLEVLDRLTPDNEVPAAVVGGHFEGHRHASRNGVAMDAQVRATLRIRTPKRYEATREAAMAAFEEKSRRREWF